MTLDELCSRTLNHIDEIMHKRALGLISPQDAIRQIAALMADHLLQENIATRP